jgi:hypothetical protein
MYVPGTLIDFETDRRAYIEWSLDHFRVQLANSADPINKFHAEMMINSLDAELEALNKNGG